MSASKVMLVFVFNHCYERNIEKPKSYYAPRFSKRKYIIPFVPIGYSKAIRVVENCLTFSGHIAQAARDFMEDDVSHYLFVADDLILNPRFNSPPTMRPLLDCALIGLKELYLNRWLSYNLYSGKGTQE